MDKTAVTEEKCRETITLDPIGIIKNDHPIPPLIASEDGLKLNEAFGSAMEKMGETSRRLSEIIIADELTDLLEGLSLIHI